MSKSKRSIRKKKQTEKKGKPAPQLTEDQTKKEKHLEILILILLICYGIYHSVLYFGHQPVPNPDFTGFFKTGSEVLSFQLPSNFKRAPVLGMLQVIISKFVVGNHPELTAGWILNSILHPLSIILLYLTGKKIIGKTALWMTVLYAVNPWIISSLRQPIAEITLLFFIILTFFFMFRHSKWAYLFASITSMVRYEGAALILTAFVMDMIYEKSTRQRIKSFILSAIASIPVLLWMLAMVLEMKKGGSTHYLKEMGETGAFGPTFARFLNMTWQTGFYTLLIPPFKTQEDMDIVFNLSKLFVFCGFSFGVVYGLIKRKWEILALLIFLLPYLAIHALHSFVLPRFAIIISWIIFLIFLYGLVSFWNIINKDKKLPMPIILLLQIILIAVSLFWLSGIYKLVADSARFSPRSTSIPYVTLVLVIILSAIRCLTIPKSKITSHVTVLAFLCLMIFSNQLVFARTVGNGKANYEFKMLADWYVKNAQTGEKMVSTMPNLLRIFASRYKENFIHTNSLKTEDPVEFVKMCYEKNVTYVAWDSRLGLAPGDRYYNIWKLQKVAPLVRPQDNGPYEFVDQIRLNKRRYINIFRLRGPDNITNQQQ